MKSLKWFLILAVAILFAFAMSAGCECDDDDDNDDTGDDDTGDDDSGDDDYTSADCQEACENMFDCGADIAWESMSECVEDCNDWLDYAGECAACIIECWTSGGGCIDAAYCMAECGFGPCLGEL